jgi:hypothetical protein
MITLLLFLQTLTPNVAPTPETLHRYEPLADFTVPVYVILAAAAVYALGVYLDDHYSSQFRTHASFEGNPLWRDKYGLPRVLLNVYVSAAIGAVLLLIAFAASSQAGTFALIGLGAPRVIYALTKLKKDMAYYRGQQTAFLRALSVLKDPTDDDLALFFTTHPLRSGAAAGGWDNAKIEGGRTYYEVFAWIYSENTDGAQAQTELRRKIYDVSQRPEAEWFPS